MLSFLPFLGGKFVRSLLHWSSVAAFLRVFLPLDLSLVSEKHAQLGWLTWSFNNILFLCVKGCFCSMFCQYSDILSVLQHLSKAEQKVCFMNLIIYPVTFISSQQSVNISDSVLFTDIHAHVHHVWQMLWIISSTFISSFLSIIFNP